MTCAKILILCVLSLPLASASPTCEECNEAFSNLVTRLLSEKSLVEQMEILKSIGCSSLPSPEDCNDLVDTWWVVMASILYPSLIVPQDLCTMAGSCVQVAKDWTWEEWCLLLATLSLRSLSRWVLTFSQEMCSVEHQKPLRTVQSRWLRGCPWLFLSWQGLSGHRRWRYVRRRWGSACRDRSQLSTVNMECEIRTTYKLS